MRIEDIRDDERISIRVMAEGREDALHAVAAAFAQANPDLQEEVIFEYLMAREAVATTGIGDGVAVPHARVPGLLETQLVVATCPDGLEFNAIDGQPVNILVGVLSPAERPRESIRALSEVARCLRDPAVRKSVVEADTRADVVKALRSQSDEALALEA